MSDAAIPSDSPAKSFARTLAQWFPRRAQFPCPKCNTELRRSPFYRKWRVCENCGHHFPLTAYERVKTLADPDTFHELEQFLSTHPRGIEYAQRVRAAKRETHLRESVIMGTAKIHAREVMLVVLDFRFLGGTMGATAGEKIARAFEVALEKNLPLIAFTASGGARIQEGMNALMQMAKTVCAVNRFQEARLPYITVLTHPTTGGVYASFANLADVILAEPRALIGFAGPRVVEILTREKLPQDSHRAEFLLEHGMVDAIVPRHELRDAIGNIVANVKARTLFSSVPAISKVAAGEEYRDTEGTLSSWSSVQLARHPNRPTTRDYITRIFSNFVELRGDHFFGEDPAIVCGVARLNDAMQTSFPLSPHQEVGMSQGVIVIGQERGNSETRTAHRGGRAEPEGYRKAQRLMRLASKWNLPLITLIDTPGADAGYESEKRGIAMSLAYSISWMLKTRAPTIAVVIGEGGSGGALALAAADRVAMLEHAVYSVISPEGASAILYGDAAHAQELADDLHLTARDLLKRNIIDAIIDEPDGSANTNADAAAQQVKAFLVNELATLAKQPIERLLEMRYAKYRTMGQ